MLGDSIPIYPLPVTIQKWAHKDTTAVAPGPDPSARCPVGLPTRAGGSEIRTWLLSAQACISVGCPWPSSSTSPLSTSKPEQVCLVDQVWVTYRTCVFAVRGASHTGRPALTGQIERPKHRMGAGQWKEWKILVILFYRHFILIIKLTWPPDISVKTFLRSPSHPGAKELSALCSSTLPPSASSRGYLESIQFSPESTLSFEPNAFYLDYS